jgi:hypothetical protein
MEADQGYWQSVMRAFDIKRLVLVEDDWPRKLEHVGMQVDDRLFMDDIALGCKMLWSAQLALHRQWSTDGQQLTLKEKKERARELWSEINEEVDDVLS